MPDQAQVERDRLFGRDVWFDVRSNDADLEVTAGGDWAVVGDRAALRQALIRRIITNPGEWQTLPEYGVGARLFLKTRSTLSARQALESRIRDQLTQDARVRTVQQVTVTELTDGPGLEIFVRVLPRGDSTRRRPLVATLEVR